MFKNSLSEVNELVLNSKSDVVPVSCDGCYYIDACSKVMPLTIGPAVWNSISEKRKWMIDFSLDCYKTPEEHKAYMQRLLCGDIGLSI